MIELFIRTFSEILCSHASRLNINVAICGCVAEQQHYKPADIVLASCEYLKLALVSVLEIYVQTHETPSVQG